VSFSYLDELNKIFESNTATGAAFENFKEVVHGLQHETIKLNKDEEK